MKEVTAKTNYNPSSFSTLTSFKRPLTIQTYFNSPNKKSIVANIRFFTSSEVSPHLLTIVKTFTVEKKTPLILNAIFFRSVHHGLPNFSIQLPYMILSTSLVFFRLHNSKLFHQLKINTRKAITSIRSVNGTSGSQK